jgi:hypothetical protein
MPTYAITWSIGETRLVKAESKAEAERLINNLSDTELLSDLKNIMQSFEVIKIEEV